MPSISNGDSTHNFITFQGQVQQLGLTVEDITRPGVNGHAFRQLALHAPPFDMLAHRDVDSTDAVAEVYMELMEAYHGRIVSIVDDLGGEYSNVVCLGIERVDSFKLLRAVGGVSTGKGAMLVIRFTFQATE